MKIKQAPAWVLALIIPLLLNLIPILRFDSAQSQEAAGGIVEQAGVAAAAPVSKSSVSWSERIPRLTSVQQSQLEYWSERTHLPGPRRSAASRETSEKVTAFLEKEPLSIDLPGESLEAAWAPGGSWLTKKSLFGSIIPAGFRSNVMESSLGQDGQFVFFTGNWFAARSIDGGTTWAYADPFFDMKDFCCDQVAISDESRHAFYWLRMGRFNDFGENRFRLGVSTDGGSTFCNYDFYPKDTNAAWTGQWWDYPHIQLGAESMYIAWNMFNATGHWTRTLMLRFPLDELNECEEFSYNYYATSGWFTFVPVQGADDRMYFASNWAMEAPDNRLGIWRWDESTSNPTFYSRTITPWSYTSRNEAICGDLSGNWAARTDDRLLAGARFKYDSLYPDRPVLGFWWNVKQGGDFPHPYIEGVAFFEDSLTGVPGSQGRPLIYTNSTCHLYPSAASNPEGHLAMVFHYGYGANLRPAVAFTVADTDLSTPPGFLYFLVQASKARPSDQKWGDYNTVRWLQSSPDYWSAGSHYIPQAEDCSTCAAPVYFTFKRGEMYLNSLPVIRR